MPTSQQRKGFGWERRIVKSMEAIGIKAERVPLSGATGYQGNTGDVDIYALPDADPLKVEVKARKSGSGWKTIETWLGEQDLLIMVEDRKSPLVTMRWNTLLELLKAIGHEREEQALLEDKGRRGEESEGEGGKSSVRDVEGDNWFSEHFAEKDQIF